MLTERQKMILAAIVDDYIRSAEPVGSRTISKRAGVGYSPATIRNEMSDLEEMGYLEQPHTSAGRIPSQKGYRYYVDHLVKLEFLSQYELEVIKVFFEEKIHLTEKVVQQVALILSNLTNYTSVVLEPDMYRKTLKHLQLVPLNEETAVAIIVTNTGQVENMTVSIPKDIPMSEIEKFVNILNAKLVGVPLLHLRSKLKNEIGNELSKHVTKYEELIQIIEKVIMSRNKNRVYHSGVTKMLNQPEFRDVEKVKSILDLFEESQNLSKIFSPTTDGSIQVRIGEENSVEAINNCSLITTTYTVDGEPVGTIGILGPIRMEYAKVMSILDYLSKDLEHLYARWYK